MTEEKILKTACDAQSQLIRTIYESPSNPDKWQDFIDRLVTVFDARSARLLWLDATATRVHTSFMVNTDPDYQQQYNDYYVNLCPWRPEIRSKPPGRLYSSYFDFSQSQEDFHRSEFYQDWARPQGIEHGIGGTVFQSGQTTVQLLLQRTREPGCFKPKEKAFLNYLAPHLRQAFVLQQQIEDLEAQNQVITQASARSPMPFMLLTASGKMAYACPAVEKALQKKDCELELRGGHPHLRNPAHDKTLARLIHQTVRAACGRWDFSGGRLQLPQRGARQLDLHISPIHWQGALTALSPERCYAIIYFHDRMAPVSLNRMQLQTSYQLTNAEAGIAELMAQGLALTEIATLLGSSIHTVRNQAKSIYAKTGTKGQTSLLHLLLTGPSYTRLPKEGYAARRPTAG